MGKPTTIKMTEEDILRIHSLWRKLKIENHVARAAGISSETARRYKPDDVPTYTRRKITRDLKNAVIDAWKFCKNSKEVADKVGCTLRLARDLCPTIPKNKKPCGYFTWSRESRERWDRMWSDMDENHLHRLASLMECAFSTIVGGSGERTV